MKLISRALTWAPDHPNPRGPVFDANACLYIILFASVHAILAAVMVLVIMISVITPNDSVAATFPDPVLPSQSSRRRWKLYCCKQWQHYRIACSCHKGPRTTDNVDGSQIWTKVQRRYKTSRLRLAFLLSNFSSPSSCASNNAIYHLSSPATNKNAKNGHRNFTHLSHFLAHFSGQETRTSCFRTSLHQQDDRIMEDSSSAPLP